MPVTVTITQPSNGATVSGVFTARGTIDPSNATLSGLLDDGQGHTFTPGTFSVNSSNNPATWSCVFGKPMNKIPNGNYTMSIRGQSGSDSNTASIGVTVGNLGE
jgi:hypothetical protein